jgi:6-phosphogluconolactonase
MAGTITCVYVANAESNEISVLRLDSARGDLAAVATIPVPGVQEPGQSLPLAVSPDRRVLYAATRGEPRRAVGFAIDPGSGSLTHVASGPLAESMAYIITDRTGRFLLGASYPGNLVSVNPIGPPGTVHAPQQIVRNHPKAHSIRVDAANRHVLVPTLGNDRVSQFTFDAGTGRLTPNDPPTAEVAAGAGPRHFVFHPGGRWVYVVGELDGQVYAFDYNAGHGTLTGTQTVSALPPGFSGPPAAADLHITPDGRFLYASVRATSTLAAFRVDPATGALTLIGSVPTEDKPRGFNIDPSGRYLLAVGQLSHRLSIYAIDPAAGSLTRLEQYAVGRNPNWVEIVDLP